MHEFGIARDILETVFKELEAHEYSKVNKIVLSVGEFNLLTQESLQNAFDLAAENTKAAGAVLELEQTPGMEIEIKHVEAE
ncbi:MAG: hydrogenase maturation nickel metallochaperone HypA [Candidatus Omnitrophica bacterium]|jgi:Zn finger protein HypA/HybF involved in hydrogenase expression|nr:hydrogenase maturation nickel metallochaperone HypA [Candidatus Omnitrophota bacterium]